MSKNAGHLKPLKKDARDNFKIATFDIETVNWTEVVFIGFYDGIEFRGFKNFDDFLDVVLRGKDYRNTYIYAHNGGKFDFLPMLPFLKKRNLQYSIVEMNGVIVSIRIDQSVGEKHRYYIEFRDSLKLLNSSLKKLADAFQVETKKGDLDFSKENFDSNNPDHIEYNRKDCISLYQVLKKFKAQPLLEGIKIPITAASTALKIYRTHFLPYPLKMTNQEVQDFVRLSYTGGRVEIFKREGENLDGYDINSLYPFIMKNRPMPGRYLYETKDHREFGFHEVSVSVPDMYAPPLPYKRKKLFFPTGILRGVFFSEELRLAESVGCKVIEHHKGHAFEKDTEIFSRFISDLYSLRMENKGTALDQVAKLAMNSCYGKFGQKEETTSLQILNEKIKDYALWRNEETFEKTGLVLVSKFKRAPYMLVHIASAITSWARIHLYQTMIEPYGESLYYCDTDSGFVDSKAVIKTGKLLGEWKHEYSIKEAFFRLPKVYSLKINDRYHYKAKGFPPEFLNNLSINDFKYSDLKSEKIRPLTLKSSIIKNNQHFSTGLMKKSLISGYDKRVFLKNGDTRPLNIKEIMT